MSCSKVKSERWITIDLEVIKNANGTSAEAILFLGYPYQHQYENQQPTTQDQKYKIGSTVDGKFYKQFKINDVSKSLSKKANLYLYINYIKSSPWYLIPYYYSERILLKRNEVNDISLGLKQSLYEYKIKLINESCYNADDVAWVEVSEDSTMYSGEYVLSYQGCYNNYMYDDLTPGSLTTPLYLKIKSKKNNIFDSTITKLEFEKGILNEFEITY
ncbi:hypothetical protein DNU06_09520 [Putridiphycobacter roseus]|uniref:Uncharacterized protein n=1 Tax=Putridiphycobacter roseus TaxID=2219161 RepID=A0A2W1N0F5_9FLAO|nr:hypothetical protein DNU06_09520 [Putridiphycobacter roseus]